MAVRLLHRPATLRAAVATLLLLAGCGQARTTPSSCRPAARAALARLLQLPPRAVAATATDDGQGLTSCRYRAGPAGQPVTATVSIDAAPQAYFRLERTAVEESQNFVQTHHGAPPQTVPGLGLDAEWFPTGSRLMTTDGTSLVTVAVAWPAGSRKERIALAGAIARTHLGPLRPAAAIPGSG